MIEKERIEAIKSSVDLKTYIESRGIGLTKNGKGYVGLCPFHDEKTPSFHVTPEKQLFHCFGCGVGGDIFKFTEMFDQVDFKQAVTLLEKTIPELKTTPKKEEAKLLTLPEAKVQQLLERVIMIYEKNLSDNDQGKKYLEDRGIEDNGLFSKHHVGYCNGKLDKILPSGGQIREGLRSIGILTHSDIERFLGCVVFPVYDLEGKIVTLYGRIINKGLKRHVFLPDRPTGLWNIGVIKQHSEIILVESVFDALSVQVAGYPNVISIQGTNGLSENDINLLKERGVQKLILLFDSDEAGDKAKEQLKEKISGIFLEIRKLPHGADPNSILTEYGAQKLCELIKDGNKADSVDKAPEQVNPIQTHPSGGFVIPCGIRQYRIMNLERSPHKLKATIRLDHAGKLHVDTLDLYSARSRRVLAQDLCRIFEEVPETVESDISRIIRECECLKDDAGKPTEPKEAAPTMSDQETAQAQSFGKSQDLIKQILKDFQTCGLIGEESNKLLGYIAMTSRKRKEPISVQILSSSGAGKTALQDAIVNFCPPEDLVKLTSLSGKALFYKDRLSLKHKVLALEEGDGVEDASYAIRSLISSGILINETTIKDLSTGRLTTMENRVEGPTAVFYTTTDPDVDPETKSRFFVTGIDESREQTRRILAFQREKHHADDISQTMKAQAVIKKHHNFQRLLKPLGVKNPYGGQLTYGDDRLQGRRDQPKYLNLIKSVAFLRQMQKKALLNGPAAYIEVDTEDIRIANNLAQEVLGRSLDELSRPGRDLLMLLDEMIEKLWQKIIEKDNESKLKRTDITFSRRDIREYTGWTNYRVHTHIKELVQLEYVFIETGKNGTIFRYRLAYEGQGKDGSKFILGLSDPEELKN